MVGLVCEVSIVEELAAPAARKKGRLSLSKFNAVANLCF
jgi:hypothetical protein